MPASTCPTRVVGRTGGFALDFDGRTQSLAIAPGGLELVPRYTIALWTRLDMTPKPGDFGCIVCRPVAAGPDDTYAVYVRPFGETVFATTAAYEVIGPSLAVGIWSHVAASYDGTTKLVYVDGTLGAMQDAPPVAVDNHHVLLGADFDNGAPTGYFPGALADVRLYDRALGADEIATLAAP